MTVSIHVTDEEYRLANSWAKKHSMTLEEAFTRTLFEQIEEEDDSAVGEEAYQDYVKDGMKSRPVAELWKEIGI